MNVRLSSLAVAAVCSSLWAAGKSRAEEPLRPIKNADTYVVANNSEIEGLDAAWSLGLDSQEIILNLYDTLFGFQGSSVDSFVPLVAREVPSFRNGLISPDGKTYTIPIRAGIRFHDGTPLTADDVRYSLLRLMIVDGAEMLWTPLTGRDGVRDSSGTIRPSAFQEADRAVRVEGDDVVLRLPRPFPPLLQILARWPPIVSRRWAAEHGDWDGSEKNWRKLADSKKEQSPFIDAENGSGPFTLERWDRAANQIVLARNERYWRAPAKIKRVVLKTVTEFHLRKLMLQAGDADEIGVDRGVLSQLEGLPGIEVVDGLPNLLVVSPFIEFCFRIDSKGNPYVGSGRLDGSGITPDFFADVDVRKAFAYSFDYDGFIRDVLKGHGSRRPGVIPDGSPGRPAYDFDLEKAREHFRKALHGRAWEKGFRFTLVLANGNAANLAAAQMLKRAVEGLNPKFNVAIQTLSVPIFGDVWGRKAPLVITGTYVNYADPHAFAVRFMKSHADRQCIYDDPKADALIDEAAAEPDPSRRTALYRRLSGMEEENPRFVMISDAFRTRVQRSWVKGWVYNPMTPELYYTVDKSLP